MTELSKHMTTSVILIGVAGLVAGIVVSVVEPYWLGLAITVAVALLMSLTAELFLRWRRGSSDGG